MKAGNRTVRRAACCVEHNEKMIEKKPNYKWPRYVLAGVLLFVAATLVWMAIEIHNVKQERNFSAPIQGH